MPRNVYVTVLCLYGSCRSQPGFNVQSYALVHYNLSWQSRRSPNFNLCILTAVQPTNAVCCNVYATLFQRLGYGAPRIYELHVYCISLNRWYIVKTTKHSSRFFFFFFSQYKVSTSMVQRSAHFYISWNIRQFPKVKPTNVQLTPIVFKRKKW